MGDSKPFTQFHFNDGVDTRIARVGLPPMIEDATQGYLRGVHELKTATLQGDLEAVSKAKEKIAQHADALESLGQAIKQANEYDNQKEEEEGGEKPANDSTKPSDIVKPEVDKAKEKEKERIEKGLPKEGPISTNVLGSAGKSPVGR